MPTVPDDPHVILTGDVIEGLSVHGPFINSEYALIYAQTFFDQWTLAPLRVPDDEDDTLGESWSGYHTRNTASAASP